MIRRLILLSLCLLLPTLAAADRPRAGILWNRSGLPATFPLQVKTLPGNDYVVFLIEPDSSEPAMAGYIRGGDFFRLLVPPGRYLLRFAYGTDWQGEDALFGPLTDWTETEKVLDFRILGTARRSGYLVTLIERNGVMKIVDARPQDWCQIAREVTHWRDWPEGAKNHPNLRHPDQRRRGYTRLCA